MVRIVIACPPRPVIQIITKPTKAKSKVITYQGREKNAVRVFTRVSNSSSDETEPSLIQKQINFGLARS